MSEFIKRRTLPDDLPDDVKNEINPKVTYNKHSRNVLTWVGNKGSITTHGIKFDIEDEKPVFSFEYTALYYEPILNNAFYVGKVTYTDENNEEKFRIGKKYMSEEEVQEVESYCESFLEQADYQVWAYEEDTKFYIGTMMKKEADAKNYKYTTKTGPQFQASKFDEKTETWLKLKATILESGHLNLDPNSICNQCMIGLTEEEYNNFPKRPSDTYTWSFKEEKWVDNRDLDKTKYNASLSVRSQIEAVRWRSSGKYTTQFEQATWMIQLQEARDYLANPDTAITPYIDTFLDMRVDEYIPDKKTFCEDIIENNIKFIKTMAEVSAIQWSFTKKIQYATTTQEVDQIEKEAMKWSNLKLKELGSDAGMTLEELDEQERASAQVRQVDPIDVE